MRPGGLLPLYDPGRTMEDLFRSGIFQKPARRRDCGHANGSGTSSIEELSGRGVSVGRWRRAGLRSIRRLDRGRFAVALRLRDTDLVEGYGTSCDDAAAPDRAMSYLGVDSDGG